MPTDTQAEWYQVQSANRLAAVPAETFATAACVRVRSTLKMISQVKKKQERKKRIKRKKERNMGKNGKTKEKKKEISKNGKRKKKKEKEEVLLSCCVFLGSLMWCCGVGEHPTASPPKWARVYCGFRPGPTGVMTHPGRTVSHQSASSCLRVCLCGGCCCRD